MYRSGAVDQRAKEAGNINKSEWAAAQRWWAHRNGRASLGHSQCVAAGQGRTNARHAPPPPPNSLSHLNFTPPGLLTLGRVITALVEGQGHVPYR